MFLINRCHWCLGDLSPVWGDFCGSWNIFLFHATRDQREDSGRDRQGAAFKQVGSTCVRWNMLHGDWRWVLRYSFWPCLVGLITKRGAVASSAGEILHSTRGWTVRLALQGWERDSIIPAGNVEHWTQIRIYWKRTRPPIHPTTTNMDGEAKRFQVLNHAFTCMVISTISRWTPKH